ncbi:MAG: hypothetical protein M1813_005507 [Trichoglossum hirsutum]|nr:MAG: hypothetical protein M1813_005507 [Trichoglossum hirsutum]
MKIQKSRMAMMATPATDPTTMPAIRAVVFGAGTGEPVGSGGAPSVLEAEVSIEVVELDEVSNVLGAEDGSVELGGSLDVLESEVSVEVVELDEVSNVLGAEDGSVEPGGSSDVLESEVSVEVVELDKVPSVLGAEVVVAGIARYKVQVLHPFLQSISITDDPEVAGLWSNTVAVLQRKPLSLHRGNVIMAT